MKCTSPIFVQDKTTGGILYVPCGQCLSCRTARARMWSVRIMHEVKEWSESCFVTLTYDDEHLPLNGSLSKTDVQNFFKRLRKNLEPRKIKYFLGAEYGDDTKRPHYHAVIFGVGIGEKKVIDRSWGNGFVHIGSVSHDSARYVASYTLKKLTGGLAVEYARRGVIPEFSLMSRNPGIGSKFCEKYRDFLKQNHCCVVNGHKVSLPRFYSDKLYTEDDKVLLHALRQEFYDETFQEHSRLAGSDVGYQVLDYERGLRAQRAADLRARVKLKRRKL